LREDLNKYKLVSSSISIIFCAGQWGGATCATSQVMQGRAVWMCLVACRSSAQTPPCAPASEAAGSTRTDRIACRPAQSTSAAAISAGSSRASGRPPSAAASRPAHPPGRSQTMITRSFALLFEGLPAGAARLAPCGRRRAAPPRRRQPRR